MQHGDLSNHAEVTLLFTWEGLLADVPSYFAHREERAAKHHRWRKVLDCWVEDDRMRKVLTDITWRKNRDVAVLTFYPYDCSVLLGEKLEALNYPCSAVYCGYPQEEFESLLPLWPWVITVYHGNVGQPFLYGGRGKYIDRISYGGDDL